LDIETANDIVDAIIYDLSDRAGLGNEWESVDADIQEQIKQEWIEIIITRS